MSLRPGGGLTVLLGVLKGLAESNLAQVHVTVVCGSELVSEEVERQGTATVIRPHRFKNSAIRYLWNRFKLAAVVNKLQPDVFLSINFHVPGIRCPQVVYHLSLLRFMPISKKLGWVASRLEWLRNRDARRALVHAAANVFESQYIQKLAGDIYPSSNDLDRVIYIGLPDSLLAVQHGRPELERDSGQLFSITNHNDHKDNPTLINTLATLCQRRPNVDWKLKIAGGIFPDLWQPYFELAKRENVFDRIEWLGFINQEELTTYLQESICLVSTSRIESFCMVAVESMARGCPAVVADSTSMPESVGDAAMLAGPGNASDFADRILELYDDRQLRSQYVDRGYKHIQKFRWSTCGDQFSILFHKLLEQPFTGKVDE